MSSKTNESFLSQVSTSFELMGKYLGFNDSTSFFLGLLFVILAFSFAVAGILYLRKAKKERFKKIQKVVDEVQSKKPEEPPKDATLSQETKANEQPFKGAMPVTKLEVEREVSKQEVAPPQKKVPQAKVEKEPVLKPVTLGLSEALAKTKNTFIKNLTGIFFGKNQLNQDDLDEVERILYTADIGVETATSLIEALTDFSSKEKSCDSQKIQEFLKTQLKAILAKPDYKPLEVNQKPSVIMLIGVNGAGKTTTIGKLGRSFLQQGKKVLVAAGDTFRAAAVEQLSLWAERVGADITKGKEGQDPASVLFTAIKRAQEENFDIVLCDTAGRLHNKLDLMEELKKSVRVVGKACEGAPHEVLLVIDATMGQNAIAQAKNFAQSAPITGVVLTKLDGTAKGGVAFGIVHELNVPIKYIGIGEGQNHLKPFCPDEFIDELFS